MVFFTCNACGESLKKAQVDKHVNMCRGCQVLSCIDCGKDFWGEDYKNHIKCITEDQKYGGKGYEAKSNKGDVKQQQWIQRIHEAMNKPGISAKIKDVLTQVSSYDNVPRKKAKFQNWMKNSLKISNPTLHDQVWEIFSAATSNAPQAQTEPPVQPEPAAEVPAAEVTADSNGRKDRTKKGKDKKRKMGEEEEDGQQNGRMKKGKDKKRKMGEEEEDGQQNGRTKKGKDKKRKRKMKMVEEEEDGAQNGHGAGEEVTAKKSKDNHKADGLVTEAAEDPTGDSEGEAASKGKFNWKGTIKAVLRQSPEEGLAVKKLRKKVLAAYYSFSGEGNFRSEEELLALFNKKINKNPKFRVLKDKVRLVK